MNYRTQKNITINEEQKDFIKENHGKMTIEKLCSMLGLGKTKVHRNMELMGMIKNRKAKVIIMSEFFDVDAFSKYYQH